MLEFERAVNHDMFAPVRNANRVSPGGPHDDGWCFRVGAQARQTAHFNVAPVGPELLTGRGRIAQEREEKRVNLDQ